MNVATGGGADALRETEHWMQWVKEDVKELRRCRRMERRSDAARFRYQAFVHYRAALIAEGFPLPYFP